MTAETIELHKLDTATHITFAEQPFYALSNFAAFNLKWAGGTFMTAAHTYHYEKFLGAALAELRMMIKNAPSAIEAASIAQRNHQFVRRDWERVKAQTMRGILLAKVSQHDHVHRALMATGDSELIADEGENIVGRLWMEIRQQIRDAQ